MTATARRSDRRHRSRRSTRRVAVLLGTVGALVLGASATLTAPATAAAPGGAATDGPGATSHQDLSRKDCVGTARNRTSKIWFTVADGVLSDVYAPTVDATNLETLQYLVTDGSTFTDLQSRDTTYTVNADPTGMACTVTSTARSGAYKIVTTYFTDPARDSVIMRTHYTALTRAARAFKLYVRMDANAGGNGGGGAANGGADDAVVDTSTGSPIPVSYDTKTTSQADRTAYAVPSYLALTAAKPFTSVSSGFVGTASDGLTQLDGTHTLAPVTATATNGNVEQTAAVPTGRGGDVTLALGFGTSQAAAVSTATATVRTPLARSAATYERQWLAYDDGLRAPNTALPGLSTAQRNAARVAYYRSANVVKASEDKTYPGAIVAGLDAPWGQSIPANDPADLFHSGYREVFARDLYEAWTALYTDGDLATARDTVRYLLLRSQQADGSEPRNSLLDGTKAADAFNIQLDESAYPLLMALQSGLAGEDDLWPHVVAGANYLISHGPSFGVERWEEQEGYSPSTISAEIAGLVAAATIATRRGDARDARIWFATADRYQASIKAWGVTTNGPLSSKPYFIRLSKTGDPNAAISYNLGNGGPTVDQRSVMDLGFLEYVRLGELPATDPDVANSLTVADAALERSTANGPGWMRYNGDGYGDCWTPDATSCTVDGAPWTDNNQGSGHPWPVLGAERAQQYLRTGNRTEAASLLATINRMNSGPGLVPEQVWDHPDLAASPYGSDPATASIGFTDGEADGSASPLTWGAGAQVRLTADLGANRDLETPAQVRDRYVTHHQRTIPITITSPAANTAVDGTTTVRGTTVAGARVDLAAVNLDHADAPVLHASTTAKADGSWTTSLTFGSGSYALIATATSQGRTGQTSQTVVDDSVQGTLLYAATDPTGDDNGPGTYAYPTASDFHAGAFDMTDFQVYDTGSTITFRVRTANLDSTFGSTNGAQLVDVYVHEPAATATSTSASYPGMNYSLAPDSAWSRLIEVQGFGNQRFVDASGATAGAVTTSANSVSRWITFSVGKTDLGGTPASGWGFTVTMTGQDGTHGTDQTRAFTSTPGAYSFGVCAAGNTAAACSADPNTVPKVMDTFTPPGITQSGELDYTAGPVTLHAITVP